MKKQELEAFDKEMSRKFKEPILLSCLAPKVSSIIAAGKEQPQVEFERKIIKIECTKDFAQLQGCLRDKSLIMYPDGWLQVFTFLIEKLSLLERVDETGEEEKVDE